MNDDVLRQVLDPQVMERDPAVPNGQFVQLVNPVRQHFETFIFANSLRCKAVAKQDSAVGQTIVICGAGPSLRDHAAKWTAIGDQVWGCNSAMPWLWKQGYRVTHGFTMDQTAHMVEEWYDAPPVEYLLGSSVHPHLTEFLDARSREMTFFHNYTALDKPPVEYCKCGHNHRDGVRCGVDKNVLGDPRPACECTTYDPMRMEYEHWLYLNLYPPTVIAGSGLNATTRAIDVALYMGAERVVLLGADCAIRVRKRRPPDAISGSPAEREWLRKYSDFHADGSHAMVSGATQTSFDGVIDGRYWVTKPDLAITAVWLERWRRKLGRKKLTIIGDVLPNALQDKSEEFLDRMPVMLDSEGRPLKYA